MDVTIRKATQEDIGEIVSVHLKSFKGFFLAQLGEEFLHHYYLSFLQSESGIILCAMASGRVVGFSACSTISRGFNRSLIANHPIGFIRIGIKTVFSSPKSALRLLANLDKRNTSTNDSGLYAELFSLSVLPEFQNLGIGGYLLKATESEIAEFNKQISLTTDFYDNDDVIRFYHNMGYLDSYVFSTYPNRKMIRMIKTLE